MFKNEHENAAYIIGEIRKNTRQKYIISAKQYRGYQFVDVRLHWTEDNGETWHPSKKGITISPEIADDVVCAIKSGVTLITASRKNVEEEG